MHNTFSIITVVKNNPDGLRKTLQSISHQTYQYIQTIVIDGASTDDTMGVCKEFDCIDVCVSEHDTGIYDAMNKGIAFAKSDWILFLNVDDVFYADDTLEKINQHINTNPNASILCGNTVEMFHGQRSTRTTRSIDDMPIYMPACHQSMLIKTEVVSAYLFDSTYTICGDVELMARLLQDNHSVSYIGECISIIDGIGISNTQWKLAKRERVKVQNAYYPQKKSALKKYHIHISMKRYIRNMLPLKMQLFVRKWLIRKGSVKNRPVNKQASKKAAHEKNEIRKL